MASTNGSGQNGAGRRVFRFTPVHDETPQHAISIEIDGVVTEFPVQRIWLLTKGQEDDMRRLEDKVTAATHMQDYRRAVYDRDFYSLRALIPTLPPAFMDSLTLPACQDLASQAWEAAHAANPSSPDTGSPSTETPSSPVSGVSTAGVTAS